ncbi:hypothetical protein M8542_39825 [Amycolatopsis sp. OK19-0408]|uniref:STAS domain-containing protein n=1 Tax=Amycolatopsis iheyensis TaxID=2945988 RepID=A0A9X2NJM3_9PSEU|nr:hypothetical protein [Amycolatopsis iheyensis]MCR6488997.1 hypothetical protein [Amycolatopsis iheyensis]
MRRDSQPACHLRVADGAISLHVVGAVPEEIGAAQVIGELAEAIELCHGTVLLDLTRCRIDRDLAVTVVHEARVQAGQCRCRLRVLAGDPNVAAAVTRAAAERTAHPVGVR